MLDTHVHLWELARADYGWIVPDMTDLYRDYRPADLRAAIADSAVENVILVQCAPTDGETDYLLGLAQAMPEVAGVVGWADFAAADARQRIEDLSQRQKLVGLRPMIQDIPDPEWMLRPGLDVAFKALCDSGLRFDALVLPPHLGHLFTLCQRYPELPVVIDHGAKPYIAKGELSPWREDMARLAELPNVHCKFSGLVTEAAVDWQPADLAPYLGELLVLFGEDRLLWGSDWPVVNLAASYGQWLETARALTVDLSPVLRQKLFADNGARFYGVEV